LGKPAPEQRKAMEEAVARAVQAWPLLTAGEMEKAMQAIHTTATPRPKPPRKDRPTGSAAEPTGD